MGSLIKNPGGTIVPCGGYVAGKEEYVVWQIALTRSSLRMHAIYCGWHALRPSVRAAAVVAAARRSSAPCPAPDTCAPLRLLPPVVRRLCRPTPPPASAPPALGLTRAQPSGSGALRSSTLAPSAPVTRFRRGPPAFVRGGQIWIELSAWCHGSVLCAGAACSCKACSSAPGWSARRAPHTAQPCRWRLKRPSLLCSRACVHQSRFQH